MTASTHPAASLSWHLSCRAVLAVLLVALTGCAGIDSAPTRFGTADDSLTGVDPYFATTLTKYLAGQPGEREGIRNGFIETRTALIDQAYAGFRQTLYTQRVGVNVGVDLATIGLNAVGTVTGSAPAKTALHALSGGLIGSKASIDKNVFFDRTMPALLAQMEAQRSTLRLRLLAGMTADAVAYPLMQARADLEEYYVAGTLVGAIGGVTNQAMVEQKARADELVSVLPSKADIEKRLTAKRFKVTPGVNDDPGLSLAKCWSVADAATQKANRHVMRVWWKNNGVALVEGPEELAFFDTPQWTDKRKAAVGDATFMTQLKGCNPGTN